MSFVLPVVEAATELGAGAEATTAATEGGGLFSRLGGMVKDFNDNPVGKILGSQSVGKYVGTHLAGHEIVQGIEGAGHAASSTIGTGPNYERVNLGSMGNIA